MIFPNFLNDLISLEKDYLSITMKTRNNRNKSTIMKQ